MSAETPSVSFVIPAYILEPNLSKTIAETDKYLSEHLKLPFEIILVLNPVIDREFISKSTFELTKISSSLRILHCPKKGKFFALQEGVKAARGEWIFITDADLPYDFSFFGAALQKLKNGADFVSGNRRHAASKMEFGIKNMPAVFFRHLIRRIFNGTVRWLFPAIATRDTQAGIKAMTASFAQRAFAALTCGGFYGDIELFLIASANHSHIEDEPVLMRYSTHKSSIRFSREIFKATYWLWKIYFKNFRNEYVMRQTLIPIRPVQNSFLSEQIEYESPIRHSR